MTSDTDDLNPAQDGVDRSDSFDIFAIMTYDWFEGIELPLAGVSGFPDSIRPQLESAVNVSISEVAGQYPWSPIQPQVYHVGPAAGGFSSHYLATVWESRDQIQEVLSAIGNAWAVLEISRRAKARLEAWMSTITWPGSTTPMKAEVSFSPAVLRDLCSEHVRRTYHHKKKLKSEWYDTWEQYEGNEPYPQHSPALFECMVVVEAGSKRYSYHVKGTGEVLKHSLRDGKVEADLPIPDLLPPPDIVIPRPEDDPD